MVSYSRDFGTGRRPICVVGIERFISYSSLPTTGIKNGWWCLGATVTRPVCVVRPRTNSSVTTGVPARRSLIKEAGIATSLGVVVAARRRRVVEVASSERHRRKLSPHTGRLLRLVPDARQSAIGQHQGVLRAEPDDGRGNRAVTSVHINIA